MWWWALATAMARPPCGTLQLAVVPPLAVVPSPPPDELQLRDTFEVTDNLYQSEHFAIRWGPDGTVDLADVQRTSEALEHTWDIEIEQLGYPELHGSDAYYFNIYIGDTGGGTPDRSGGGVTNIDDDGYIYIVLGRFEVADYGTDDDDPDQTIAHEFAHAIQFTTERYEYLDDSAWYWEAHAEWMVPRVFAVNSNISSWVGAYAIQPQLSLFHFDYPDTGSVIEYHQYGAELFLTHLSEHWADDEMIRATWLDSDGGDTPLDAIDTALRARGSTLDAAFADFPVRNAVWDYERGDQYDQSTQEWGGDWPGFDDLFADRVTSEGIDWTEPERAGLPWSMAYNTIRLRNSAGRLAVGFVGDPEGSEGTEARWYASLVVDHRGSYQVYPIVAGMDFNLVVLDDVTAKNTYLVISQHARGGPLGEKFGYHYKLLTADGAGYEAVPGQGPRGCGCATAPVGIGSWGWMLLLGVHGLRRRYSSPRYRTVALRSGESRGTDPRAR